MQAARMGFHILGTCLWAAVSLSPAVAADLSLTDIRFLEAAAMANVLDAKAGALVQQRAARNDVKSLAASFVEEREWINEKLQDVASQFGLGLPAQPDGQQQSLLAELGGKNGAAFERLYLDRVGIALREDVARRYKSAAQDAVDKDVRRYAAQGVPIIQAQLNRARAVQRGTDATQKAGPAAATKQ